MNKDQAITLSRATGVDMQFLAAPLDQLLASGSRTDEYLQVLARALVICDGRADIVNSLRRLQTALMKLAGDREVFKATLDRDISVIRMEGEITLTRLQVELVLLGAQLEDARALARQRSQVNGQRR